MCVLELFHLDSVIPIGMLTPVNHPAFTCVQFMK